MLLDTNIVICACKADGALLLPWTGDARASVASVTFVEALGFTGISPAEDAAIRGFLTGCLCYPLDDEVIERAVSLRQQRRMKLGDALIAATALLYALPLVTPERRRFQTHPRASNYQPFHKPALRKR